MKIPAEVFESHLMDRDHHDRLIADLPKVVEVAGIQPKFVWSRLSQYCSGTELKWVANIRSKDSNGLAYTGKTEVPIEDKMMAITGACLRNYIDARMMSIQEVLARTKDGDMPFPTVLLIPNFFLNRLEGETVPSWQVSNLLGMLYARLSKDLKTIVYVGNMDELGKAYGLPIQDHITTHFVVIDPAD